MKSRVWILILTVGVATAFLLGGFTALQAARGQAQPPAAPQVILKNESLDGNTRQVSGPAGSTPDQPTIGFIDSPSAACVQPDASKNECFVNWYYLSVDASPNYMITMTAALGPGASATQHNVAQYRGFFQTSMYVPFNMTPQGYKVACGAQGSGGINGWGAVYQYTIRARDSVNLGSANYGSVVCPAFP